MVDLLGNSRILTRVRAIRQVSRGGAMSRGTAGAHLTRRTIQSLADTLPNWLRNSATTTCGKNRFALTQPRNWSSLGLHPACSLSA